MGNRVVYIEFTSPKGKWFPVFSWVVRLVEKMKASHVRISWESSSGEWLTYEASGSAVKLLGRYGKENHQVHLHHFYKFELTQEQYLKLLGLFRYAGVQYGAWQILGIGIARLFGLKKNPLSSGRYAQICSELVAVFLKEVLNMDVPESFDLVGPRSIKELLDKIDSVQYTPNE